MEATKIIQAFFALIFVLSLLGVFSYIMRRFKDNHNSGVAKEKNLELMEVKIIDAKTKLALVKCREEEHLLLISGDGAQIISSNMPEGKPKKTAKK